MAITFQWPLSVMPRPFRAVGRHYLPSAPFHCECIAGKCRHNGNQNSSRKHSNAETELELSRITFLMADEENRARLERLDVTEPGPFMDDQ